MLTATVLTHKHLTSTRNVWHQVLLNIGVLVYVIFKRKCSVVLLCHLVISTAASGAMSYEVGALLFNDTIEWET